jgi:hypothetical protein
MGISAVLLTVGYVSMAADPHAYVGNKKCSLKPCHNSDKQGKIYDKWTESKHANAYQTLVDKGEEKNESCLGCHTTGLGKTGGFDPAAPKDDLKNVGCESCHGAGNDYWKMTVMKDPEKRTAAGCIDKPTEEVCKGCHNEKSPTFKGFDFKTAFAQIEHRKP